MKHRIIQMIEQSTGDYHYPVTLYEAIMDSVGTPLEDILRRKLAEFGIEYDEIVNHKIDNAEDYIMNELRESDIKEIREEITLINNKLSTKESQLSYLASNWAKGIIPIDVQEICKYTPRRLYIAEMDQPPTGAVVHDYWMYKEDNTIIKELVSEGNWVVVSENTAIVLYALTTAYARRRGQILIKSGITGPFPSGTDMTSIGDIFFAIRDKIVPYIWLGTVWSPIDFTPSIEEGAVSSIDDIVNLVSVRYVTVGYSPTPINVDYRYDGAEWHSEYGVTDSQATFLRSVLPDNLSQYANIIRRVYVCPKKPTDAGTDDVWISVRDNRLYVNISNTDSPIWVLQVSSATNSTDIKCTNLLANTEVFDAFIDRMLWMDIRTGLYSTLSAVDHINGFGVQDLYGYNKSISQKVRLRPNTLYTYSVYMKPRNAGERPVINFLADGCEIHETSHLPGSTLEQDNYERVWMLFTTGPEVHESNCRIESVSDYHILCYAPCLQEGFKTEWSPSFIDADSGFKDALEAKSHMAVIYRESTTIPLDYPVRDSYMMVTNNATSIKLYVRDHWEDVDLLEYPDVNTALESVYSIYTTPGITRLFTQHSTPSNPVIGDYWIQDDLSVLRYTGVSWGSINGVLASETTEISARLLQSNDVVLQSLFLQSSINADDLLDIAQSLDPQVSLYKQGTEPENPRSGDLWENTITGIILRYNGVLWVPTGSAQVSNIKQDIDGIETDVSEIFDSGSGRNYLRNSISIAITGHIQAIYTDLEENTKYVFSVESSSAVGVTQYKVRLMDVNHTIDYDNTDFTVGGTLNIWRFDTSVVPADTPAHLVITYADAGSDLVLTKVQLEKGHVYTDWKVAIEEVEESINVVNENLSDVQDDVISNIREVDRISQDLIDAINISNEALARAVTVTQTSESFSITASALTSTVTNMRTQLETYSSVFDFKPEGLQITSLVNGIRSDISTYYRSNGMYFWSESAGSDVGYVTADGLNIRNARVQLGGILAIGNFQFKPRPNGSLSLIYMEE